MTKLAGELFVVLKLGDGRCVNPVISRDSYVLAGVGMSLLLASDGGVAR